MTRHGRAYASALSLVKVHAFHEALSSRPRALESVDDFADVFEGTVSASSRELIPALHEALVTVCGQTGPATRGWLESLRPNSRGGGSRGVGSSSEGVGASHLDPLRSFCCAMLAFCEGTIEEKLHAGFDICSRQKTLDLQGVLEALQGGMLGVQALQRHCFGDEPPEGMTLAALRLFRFDWKIVESLLREGPLAALQEMDNALEEEAKSRGPSTRMLLSLRGVSAPKLNAAQLWQILNDYLSELVKGDGTWGTVDKMLSEHAHSLKIDESLEAEQMQHLEVSNAPPAPPVQMSEKARKLLGLPPQ
uniref:Uncharacterized protein n=1 Tax=Prymnesium polylepis TaxID=72548 RepID=A0A7S4HDE1_9EUKA